jgi:hypothetical protein
MIFDNNQISEILKIIDKNIIISSGITLGIDVLTDESKMLLESYGIDVDDFKSDFPQF